ncbi:hypothetical protein K438DRAFT_2096951, partial [Mycena galopus ATCC 62051]
RVFNSSERRARVTEILCLRPEGRHGRVSHGSAQPQERAVYVDVWLAGSDPMENTLLLTEQRRSLGWSTATASSTLSDQLYGSLSRRKMRYPGGGAAALEASATAPSVYAPPFCAYIPLPSASGPGPGSGGHAHRPAWWSLNWMRRGMGKMSAPSNISGFARWPHHPPQCPASLSHSARAARSDGGVRVGGGQAHARWGTAAHLTSGRTYYAYAVAQPLLSSAGH